MGFLEEAGVVCVDTTRKEWALEGRNGGDVASTFTFLSLGTVEFVFILLLFVEAAVVVVTVEFWETGESCTQ